MKTATNEPRDAGAPPRTVSYHELGHEYLVLSDPRVALLDSSLLERHPPVQHDPEHHELTYVRRTFAKDHAAVADAITRLGYYPLNVPKHLTEDIKALPGILACRAYTRQGEVKPHQYDYFAITRETYESAVAIIDEPRPINRDQRLAIQDLLNKREQKSDDLEPIAHYAIDEIDDMEKPLRDRVAAYELSYDQGEQLTQFTRPASKRQRELLRELISQGRAHPHNLGTILGNDPRKRDEDRPLKLASASDQSYLDHFIENISAGSASYIIDHGFAHASSDQRKQVRAIFEGQDTEPEERGQQDSIRQEDIWQISPWEAKAAIDNHDRGFLAKLREDELAEELASARQERSEHFFDTRIHPFDIEPYTTPFQHHRRALPREGTYFGKIIAIVKQGTSIRYTMLHLPGTDEVLELQRSQGRGFATYLSDLENDGGHHDETKPTDYLDAEDFQQAYRNKYASIELTIRGKKAFANIRVLPEILQPSHPTPTYIATMARLGDGYHDRLSMTSTCQQTTMRYILAAIEMRPFATSARIATPNDLAPGANATYLGSHDGIHFIHTSYTNLISAVDPDDIGVFDHGIAPGERVVVGQERAPLRPVPDIFLAESTPSSAPPRQEAPPERNVSHPEKRQRTHSPRQQTHTRARKR